MGLDTFQMYEELRKTFGDDAARVLSHQLGRMYTELANTVTKEDFSELKKLVGELIDVQKRTEENLARLTGRVDCLEQAVEELAEAQKRTESRVEELAEAQKRTNARLEELARAQKKTEESLQALSEEVRQLTREHKKTRQELGGLSHTVGYRLEDEAFKALPGLLKERKGIRIEGRLKRTFLKNRKGRWVEVNIYGFGKKNGKKILILGEAKSQLKKRDVDEFMKKLNQLENGKNVLPVFVTYMIVHPDVEDYVKEKGIELFYSYEF